VYLGKALNGLGTHLFVKVPRQEKAK